MTEIIIKDIDEVIQISKELIQTYKKNLESETSEPYKVSYRGSIVGLVALLARITDKSADEYFNEIFNEEE